MVKIPDKYLDKNLITSDLKQMCLELNLRDSRGQVAMWRKLKQIIIDERHYSVIPKRVRINGKPTNTTVISKVVNE